MGNKSTKTSKYWRGTNYGWDNTFQNQSFAVSQDFVRNATDMPKFKAVIKAGGNATNPMFVSTQDVYVKPGSSEVTWTHKTLLLARKGKKVKQGFVIPNTFAAHTERPGVLFRASVSNAALVGIIKKIRKYETSDFAGPTFCGELRETLAMIRSPLKALRTKTGLFTDLHMRILRDKQAKGKRFKPESWTKVISDTYLEWAFGAAPLMSDIAGIIDAFLVAKSGASPRGLKRLSYRFTDSYHDLSQSGFATDFTGCKYPYNEIRSFRASSQYVVWVDNDLVFLGQDAAKRVSQAAKFDLFEVIPTAWELMPWSFLIDYWTNIGDVLGCTFDFNRNVAFNKVTEVCSCIRYHVPTGSPYSPESGAMVVSDFVPWNYTSMYKTIDRRSVGLLGFPQLAVSLPSLGQAVNMAALMTSLFRNNPFRGHTLK